MADALLVVGVVLAAVLLMVPVVAGLGRVLDTWGSWLAVPVCLLGTAAGSVVLGTGVYYVLDRTVL